MERYAGDFSEDPTIEKREDQEAAALFGLRDPAQMSPEERIREKHKFSTDKSLPWLNEKDRHHGAVVRHMDKIYRLENPEKTEADIQQEQRELHRQGQEKLEKAKAEKLEKDRIRAVEDLKSEFGPRYQTILEQADEAFDSLPADLQGKLESANVLQRSKFVKGLSMVREAIIEGEAERSGRKKVTYEKG